MNKKNLLRIVSAFAIATAVTASAEQGTVKVIGLKGRAQCATAAGQWKDVKVGDVLPAGVVFRTATDSILDLQLVDRERAADLTAGVVSPNTLVYQPDTGLKLGPGATGPISPRANVVRLMESTVLAVDNFTWTPTGVDVVVDVQLDLRQGKIFGMTRKITGSSKFEIKLPNGVAQVRGTVYSLDAEGNAAVVTGLMVLSLVKPDGTIITRDISGNKGYIAKEDQIHDLPGVIVDDIVRRAAEFGPSLRVPPTPFTADMTVYYISPVKP